MKGTPEKNDKVANMVFASIYPLYLNRLEKNGRTKEEFDQVLRWFTGLSQDTLQTLTLWSAGALLCRASADDGGNTKTTSHLPS